MANDLHERVAALLCAETHHCASKRGCDRKPCRYAINEHGAQAAAVIPMLLEETAKVIERGPFVGPDAVSHAIRQAAAIRALGQPK